MSTTLTVTEAVWLCPRPLARCPSRFPLIPLLPHKPACKPLPSEVWSAILEDVFALYDPEGGLSGEEIVFLRRGLLLISKDLTVSFLFAARYYVFIYPVGGRAPIVLRAHPRTLVARIRQVRCPSACSGQEMGLHPSHTILRTGTLGADPRPRSFAMRFIGGRASFGRGAQPGISASPVLD